MSYSSNTTKTNQAKQGAINTGKVADLDYAKAILEQASKQLNGIALSNASIAKLKKDLGQASDLTKGNKDIKSKIDSAILALDSNSVGVEEARKNIEQADKKINKKTDEYNLAEQKNTALSNDLLSRIKGVAASVAAGVAKAATDVQEKQSTKEKDTIKKDTVKKEDAPKAVRYTSNAGVSSGGNGKANDTIITDVDQIFNDCVTYFGGIAKKFWNNNYGARDNNGNSEEFTVGIACSQDGYKGGNEGFLAEIKKWVTGGEFLPSLLIHIDSLTPVLNGQSVWDKLTLPTETEKKLNATFGTNAGYAMRDANAVLSSKRDNLVLYAGVYKGKNVSTNAVATEQIFSIASDMDNLSSLNLDLSKTRGIYVLKIEKDENHENSLMPKVINTEVFDDMWSTYVVTYSDGTICVDEFVGIEGYNHDKLGRGDGLVIVRDIVNDTIVHQYNLFNNKVNVTPTPTPTLTPMPETTSTPEATIKPTPETTPETTPKPTETATPKKTPEATIKPTPETTPETTPKPTETATPKETPEATIKPIPETTPETTPKPTETATPKKTPEATIKPIPEITPETTPKPTPEETPQVTISQDVIKNIQNVLVAAFAVGKKNSEIAIDIAEIMKKKVDTKQNQKPTLTQQILDSIQGVIAGGLAFGKKNQEIAIDIAKIMQNKKEISPTQVTKPEEVSKIDEKPETKPEIKPTTKPKPTYRPTQVNLTIKLDNYKEDGNIKLAKQYGFDSVGSIGTNIIAGFKDGANNNAKKLIIVLPGDEECSKALEKFNMKQGKPSIDTLVLQGVTSDEIKNNTEAIYKTIKDYISKGYTIEIQNHNNSGASSLEKYLTERGGKISMNNI